jgi:Spy/CpxP family protein refolding chaperone
LNVTDDQNKQLDELQKEVDAKLAKILTDDQQAQLKQMRNRGPGGRNGFGPPPPGRPPGPPRPDRQE